jgi:hypothetical protein
MGCSLTCHARTRRGCIITAITWLLSGGANLAAASTPACFPERTLLGYTAQLFDDHGNDIGAIRGKTVKVADDHVGPNGEWAEIQIDRPIVFRARVKSDVLFAFLRRDLAIIPGESWWTTDAPMRIGDRTRGGVFVEPEHGKERRGDRTLITPCASLAGKPRKRLTCDPGGCRVDFSERSLARTGRAVELPEGLEIKVQLGPGIVTQIDPFFAHAIRERGSQTLVEIADPWEQLRVRRWLPSAALRTRPDNVGEGRIPGNIEGASSLGLRGDVTVHPIALAAAPGGAAFATLPKNVVYRVLEMREGQVRIVARWPSWDNEQFVDVRGWTSAASLPSLPDPRRVAAAVRGRIGFTAGVEPKVMSDLSVFADDGEGEPGRPTHSTTVGPDGTFYLEVGEPETLPAAHRWDEGVTGLDHVRVVVRNKTGDLSGVATNAPVLAGGADEVEVTVGHSREVSGVLETGTGARVPSAEVRLAAENAESGHPLFRTTTADDGTFHFLAPPDHYVVTADDASPVDVNALEAPAPVAVRIPRRPIVFGAVPRGPDGRCLAAAVNGEIANDGPTLERRYQVTGDCLFVAEELPREVNSSRFWIRLPDGSEVEASRETYVPPGHGVDPAPVCLRDPCPANVVQSSLMVDVADAGAVRLTRAQVEVRVDDRVIGTCTAMSGRCYVHHLATGALVRVHAVAGAAAGESTLRLIPGVNEVLIKTLGRPTP